MAKKSGKVATKKAAPKKATKKPVKAAKPAAAKKVVKKIAVKKIAKKIIKPVKAKKAVVKLEKKKDTKVVKNTKPAKEIKKTPVKPIKEKELKVQKNTKPEKMAKPLKEVAKPIKLGKSGKKAKSKGGDDDEPVLEDIQELLELEEIIVKAKPGRAKKIKEKKIKQIFIPFNPIQPVEQSGKAIKKEPKGKFEIEYVLRCSEALLYDFVTSPSGLSEWFADDVNIRDGVYTFFWDGSEQQAKLLALKEDLFVRFQWMDRPDGSFFEFKIQTDELTGDVSLIIIDFADNENEKQGAKLLWDTQVEKLMKKLGSHT